MAFFRPKISTRIYLGFGIILALGIAVAGVGLYQLAFVGQQVDRLAVLSTNIQRLLTTSRDLETMRLDEASFEENGDAASLTEHSGSEDAAKARLGVQVHNAVSPVRRKVYADVLQALTHRDETVDRYVHYTKSAAEARTRLVGAGQALTAAAEKLVLAARGDRHPKLALPAADLGSAVLLVRVANWRFIATKDPNGPTTFRINLANATAALRRLRGIPGGVAAPVAAALQAYGVNFEEFADATLKASVELKAQMQPQMAGIQQQLAGAISSLAADYRGASAGSLAAVADARYAQGVLAIALLVVGTGLAAFIGRGITRPLIRMTHAMKRLAGGDTALEIPSRRRNDELGDMARAVGVFRQNAIDAAAREAAEVTGRAAKERRQKAMNRHTQDFGTSIGGVMNGLLNSAGAMREAASDMSKAIGLTRNGAAETTSGAEESSASLASVASAIAQMSASVNAISQQVTLAGSATRQAVDQAAATDTKVGSLVQAAGRIGEVVGLISSIAGQTNLLALNATIEAARAGEAGRGFAVVAGEVKALAGQTAKATQEIRGQVSAIRTATDEAQASVRAVGHAIREMENVATLIAAAVEQQASATREIAMNVQTANSRAQGATSAMQAVLRATENADTASQKVAGAAEAVGATSSTLQSEVKHFLSAMSTGREDERRRFERVPGNGATAKLVAPGHAPANIPIKDISQGGVALLCDWSLPAGQDVALDLPGGECGVPARVLSCQGQTVSLIFRQDAETSLRADRAVMAVAAARLAA
jgi:methyl-accepting chemotaxis protein